MTVKGLVVAAIAVSGVAFPALADPGVGTPAKGGAAAISDLGPLNLIDSAHGTYNLVASVTGSRPKQGNISGTATSCAGAGFYEVAGMFTGVTVHLSMFLANGGNCLSYVVDCVVNLPTKTCTGTSTNENGFTAPITLSKQ